MRHFLLGLIGFALISGAVCNAQTATDVNEGCRMTQDAGTGGYTLSWWGKNARTYFIQHSDDLVTWTYMPIIESGAAAVTEYGFNSTGQRFFLRLRHTDAATGGNPDTADFDSDGLTNLQEIEETGPHTDPLIFDTDRDGFGDGFETQKGTDPLNPAESPLTLGQQQLAELQALVAAYLNLLAGGTATIDELANAWGEIRSSASSLQIILSEFYDATIDAGVQGALDDAINDVNGALGDAGDDPGTPPFIRLAQHTKEAWNHWYSGGGSLLSKLNGVTQVDEEGYFAAAWIGALADLEWPEDMTVSNSIMGSANSAITPAHAWWDSQFGGGGDRVEVRDTRICLLSDKPVTAPVTQTYIRVLRTLDFHNDEHLPDVFLGVDTLTINQGGTKSSSVTDNGMITIAHPEMADGKSQNIILRPLEIVRDYDVPEDNYQSITGQMAKALPGQKINLKLQAPNLPEGVVISNFSWNISGVLFGNYVANSSTGHLTPSTANGSHYTEVGFYWADTGQKSVRVTYKVNGEPHESSVIIQVVKPQSSLKVTNHGSAQYQDSSTISGSGTAGLLGSGTLPNGLPASGIEWQGNVQVPPVMNASNNGRFCFCQIVTPQRHYTTPGGATFTAPNNGIRGLDGSFPYGTMGEFVLGEARTKSDSPSQHLNKIADSQYVVSNETFSTYLMLRPEGTASCWVPLKTFDWSYSITCDVYTGILPWMPTFTTTGASETIPLEGTATSAHPQWTFTHNALSQ